MDKSIKYAVHDGVHIAYQVVGVRFDGPARAIRCALAIGIRFVDLGAHALKGVPGEWVLFAVEQ
jgi:hypothetical protein